MTTQTFKSEGSARAAARKARLDPDNLTFARDAKGKWTWAARENEAAKVDAEAEAAPVSLDQLGEAKVAYEAELDAADAADATAAAMFGPPAPDADAPVLTEAEAARAAEQLVTEAQDTLAPAATTEAEAAPEGDGHAPMPSEGAVMLGTVEDRNAYGASPVAEAMEMARMLAESDKAEVVVTTPEGAVIAVVAPPAPVAEAEAPAPDAPPAPAPAPTPAPVATVNPPTPELPHVEGGYILRLKAPDGGWDGKIAFQWACTLARGSKNAVEVVNPSTGEVVAVGGLKAPKATTPAAPASAEPKAPRVTRAQLAENGQIPPAPAFASEKRQAKYGRHLADLQEVVATEDLDRVRAFVNFEGKLAGGFRALEGWRQQVIRALEARAAAAKQAA